MSLGVNLVVELAKKATAVLGNDFDIEIVEMHHNQKIDAPSGTALMIADAVRDELDGDIRYEYDRHSKRAKRPKNEIGFHSVRGGTIVGEHDVIFAGRDEVITLSHQATSKQVFAVGAIRAAKFIKDKPQGLYDMNSILNFD
jgi:4-hydroxy-tetrahydrodipicolinate reductase